MARDGSGTYTNPFPDFIAGTTILSAEVDANFADIATALTQSLAKDGQTLPSANLPMAGFRHTGVGNAAARNDYAATGQVQDSSLTYALTTGTDTILATLTPSLPAYAIGQRFTFKKDANANTGAATLNINSVGAGAVQWPNGAALVAGDLPANCMFTVAVQATTPVFQLQSVQLPPVYLSGNQTVAGDKTFSGTVAMSAKPLNHAKGADLASAATVNIGAATGNLVHITGTTTITAFDSVQAGTERTLVFDGALTLTHNGTSLILPGAANIVTAAGDIVRFVSEGSGNWRCLSYQRSLYTPDGGQIVSVTEATLGTGTTAIPLDDTIPQNTEGDQYLALSITPRSASSRLIIDTCINISSSAQDNPVVALFQDSTADAIRAVISQISDANACDVVRFDHTMTSGTTSATTFKVRVGTTSAATITVNGFGSARKLGGAMAATMVIREKMP